MAFEPEGIIKRTKGKMIMLYAIVDGEETHMASFFHNEKAQYVLECIESSTTVDIVDEDAKPKKKTKKKSTVAKRKAKK